MPNNDGLTIRIAYDPAQKRYVEGGKVIARESVQAEIDKLTEYVAKEALRIGSSYSKGRISLAEFEVRMRELLKSSHIIASSVGRGGKARMTLSDWGKVGARLKKEYGYLAKFVRKVSLGKVSKVATPHRASLYASSVRMSYHTTVHKEETKNSVSDIRVRLVQNSKEGCEECAADAARGWVAVEDMDEIGSRICGNFCLCELIFDDDI